MVEFTASGPRIEVVGHVIQAFLAGFPQGTESVGLRILESHGIKDPRSGEWYQLQAFLNATKEIAEKVGPHMLSRIGGQIASNAQLPPGLDSLEKCLASIDTSYYLNHRGGEIGHYHFTSDGSEGGLKRGKMVCPNPYGCSFDRGVIEGFVTRFSPNGTGGALVRHDDSRPCRRKGGDSCTYLIAWK